MHWEERFRQQAEHHDGLIAWFHLPEIGCTSDHWWRAIRSGRWELWSPRVLGLCGLRSTDGRRAMAAVLDASPGGMLHGPSALAWLGLRGFNLTTVQVARVRCTSGRPAHLGQLHILRAVRPHHVLVVRNVVTENALRAIWVEAARYAAPARRELGIQRIGRLLDAAHRQHLVTWAGLDEMVHDIRERGRSGTVIMRTLAADRPPGSSPTDTRNEDRLVLLLAEAGARALRPQLVVGGHEPIGRADFVDDRLPVVIEVNSLTFHTDPSDVAADLLRYRRLNDIGFTVGVVWEDDLWSDTRGALSTVAEARRLAAAGRAVTIHSPGCPWPPSVLEPDLCS